MKLSEVISNPRKYAALLFAMLLFCLNVSAQDQKIVLPASETPIKEAIAAIEKQTNYVFTYNSTVFDTGRIVDFGANELGIDEALQKIVKNKSFTYMIKGYYIAITQKSSSRHVASQIDPAEKNRMPVADAVHGSDTEAEPESQIVTSKAEQIIDVRAVSEPSEEEEEQYVPVNYVATERKFDFPRKSPSVALKTNLLYLATTTPNISLEFGMSRKTTLDLTFGYNGFKFESTGTSNRKFMHWLVMPETRYWFCKSFEGTYMGLHGFYGKFNVENIPLIDSPDYRAKGSLVGGGLSLGRHWALGKRWGIEAQLGLGVAYLDYNKYDCGACGQLSGKEKKWYFGPTKCTFSFAYFIK